jgi:hypothetical protein
MIRLSPGLAISVLKSNPLMKPGHNQQTAPATAKTMASALIIVAIPCPKRLSRNHALHHGRADAHGAAVHAIRAQNAPPALTSLLEPNTGSANLTIARIANIVGPPLRTFQG